MRRILCLVSCALLLLSLGACGRTVPVPETPAPSPAETPEPTPAPAPVTAAPTPAPTPTADAETTPPPPDGTLTVTLEGETTEYPAYTFSLDLNGDGSPDHSLLLPSGAVTVEERTGARVLRCVSEPEAASLELAFVMGTDAETLLPGLMDGYLRFTEIEFSEAAALGGVRGDVGRVTASDGETTADAWLLDAEGGVITAVLLRRTDAAGPEGELLSRVLESFRET